MSRVAGALVERAPGVHRAAMWGKARVNRLRGIGGRARLARLARSGEVVVDVSGRSGMGGLLSNTARALAFGESTGVEVAIRLSSPTYMPVQVTTDWLDLYFERTGTAPRPHHGSVEVGAIGGPDPGLADSARLVWGYMRIAEAIRQEASPYMTGSYAAVHFRGSDKHLEAEPVAPNRLLDEVEREMSLTGLERLFVASDDASFFDLARSRIGNDRCFVLPQQAVAAGARPAHFSEVPGEVKAREALLTMLVLSGARTCIRVESLLSWWAETLARDESRFVLVRP